MWVVKIGGSLIDSPYLRGWLELLAARGGGRVVIVPGGGPFAVAVRAAQARWQFNDAAAHQMALLAMAQYAHLLMSLCPQLQPATSRPEIDRMLQAGRVPVWLPVAMAADAGDISKSWEVTSDSLALWLAGQLGAHRLVLVKWPAPDSAAISAQECVYRGVVDVAFPSLLRRWPIEVSWVGAAQLNDFADALVAGNKTTGAAIRAPDAPELEAAAG
jgi:aspartokinase-like uncharacterized kinase